VGHAHALPHQTNTNASAPKQNGLFTPTLRFSRNVFLFFLLLLTVVAKKQSKFIRMAMPIALITVGRPFTSTLTDRTKIARKLKVQLVTVPNRKLGTESKA
jgi:hypothetical protein